MHQISETLIREPMSGNLTWSFLQLSFGLSRFDLQHFLGLERLMRWSSTNFLHLVLGVSRAQTKSNSQTSDPRPRTLNPIP